MKNAEMAEIINRFDVAMGDFFTRVRAYESGSKCRFCLAPKGKQHRKECVIWPLIEARSHMNKIKDGQEAMPWG